MVSRVDELLKRGEAKFNRIKDKSTYDMTPQEEAVYYAYLDLRNMAKGLKDKRPGTYQVNERGELFLSYPPVMKWENAEERVGEIEQFLSR